MRIRFKTDPIIENIAMAAQESLDCLRCLLMQGVRARPDPKPWRARFCDVQDAEHIYWIYLSPRSGHVTLLAVWSIPATPAADSPDELQPEMACANFQDDFARPESTPGVTAALDLHASGNAGLSSGVKMLRHRHDCQPPPSAR